jgi:hypothetical protein
LREEREDGMNLVNDGDLTIAKIAPLIRKKKLSPVELVNAMLARIERFQPALNAFITVTSRLARSQARQAEKEISKGHYRGPLHGIPISAKCQDIDNPGFGLGCVNTPITRIKVRGPKREATGRVSKEPVPRQNKPGFDASE